ncbi:MAG TPA: isochorismate synthase [Candidatus Dormibacteraeota bacterium]|nr:isochorismate synthase [Candidatus Dormibacteraeota bacterium]
MRLERTAAADLLSLWDAEDGFLLEREGAGLAAAGTTRAAVVQPGPDQGAEAGEVASELLRDLDAGSAVVVGALAFDGGVPARLWVPARILRTTAAGGVRADLLGDAGDGAAEGPPPPVRRPPIETAGGGRLSSRPEPDPSVYAAAVSEAVERIRRGALRKVVLARTLELELSGDIDATTVLRRLRRRDPGCHTFAVRGADGRMLLGATPETLLRRHGRTVVCGPMAGSAPRSPDPEEDAAAARRLLASQKDHREHRLVVEAMSDALVPFCETLEVDPVPRLTATASLWHLTTTVRGRLVAGAPGALGLAAALQPTPAVCGTPRAAALDTIHELEPVPRGLYSGLVGWVDAAGDGEWVVALRCATLSGRRARLYAGAGIVEGSIPALEVAETEAKFSALLTALGG